MEDIIIDQKLTTARRRSMLLPLLSLCVASACGAQADLPVENLGNTADTLSGVTENATGKARLNGRWVGQAEEPVVELAGELVGYTFPSGSRDVTLDLLFDENSLISGSVVFGAGTPPAPQAGVSHPAGLNYGLAIVSEFPPVEGFAYDLGQEQLDFDPDADEAAMLSYDQFGAFAQWCPLQPPVLRSDGQYDCLGFDGYGGTLTEDGFVCFGQTSDGTTADLDCSMAPLCTIGGPCSCDAGGCSQQPSPLLVLIELSGAELTASFMQTKVDVGLPNASLEPLEPLRLQRVAP